MKSKIFGAAAGRAMAVSTVMLIAVLLLAPDASAASKYKTLYNFSGGADGNASEAGLIFDTAGNLYGTTYNGGAYGEGTVFKLTPNGNGTWTETVLHSFGASSDGASPWASVILDDSGNLYGTTNHGGISDYGSVFELTPNADGSWSETTLYSFAGGADGTYPVGGVTLDATGRLFGMTTTGGKGKCRYLGLIGCGTVYMLVPNQDGTWTETVLYRFSGGKDGGYPDHNSPLFDSAGNLYGLARNGGLAGACSWGDCGVVFRLKPNPDGSWTYKVLHRFTGADGGNPDSKAQMIFDSLGSLYGTALLGGSHGAGVAFRLTPGSDDKWSMRVLHHFRGGQDGAYPYAGLAFDAMGNLYGATESGGAYGYGVVFKLTPTSGGKWTEHLLHVFADKPGAYLRGQPIFDASGNLYGTSAGDGHKTFGSVFEITP